MYKLTNQHLQTYGIFQWKIGKWYRIPNEDRGQSICTKSYFHCYNHPLLAMFFNPIYGKFRNPRLFKINVRGKKVSDNNVKYGYTMMKLKKELPVPKITITQRVRFAILCAKQVIKDKQWNEWADNWLSGKNRTWSAAYDITGVTCTTVYTVVDTVADAIARAAAGVSAYATYAVYAVTDATDDVICVAADTGINIDLIKLAKEAMKGD